MSLTSCWILGEYCFGVPSNGGVAMASEWVAGLVFRSLRAHRAGACRGSCCLENNNGSDKRCLVLRAQGTRHRVQIYTDSSECICSSHLVSESKCEHVLQSFGEDPSLPTI